jgi:hypothetical protein
MERIVPRDKLLRDALDRRQKESRARKRVEGKEREYRSYAGDRITKHLRRELGK